MNVTLIGVEYLGEDLEGRGAGWRRFGVILEFSAPGYWDVQVVEGIQHDDVDDGAITFLVPAVPA